MKLLVCDIEGTIIMPHMIKSAQHASYIWTAIAEQLGKEAERLEINTQRKWSNNGYGPRDTGEAYMKWVKDSIDIHRNFGLNRTTYEGLIAAAPYFPGTEQFFHRLNRDKYIPVFISGGMQNLNLKACRDLNVDPDNSYASCEYFFDSKDRIDKELTFMNTSNFYGKEELIRVSLRKHGLGEKDWVFIGDGINDVPVAKAAPLSIGIAPIKEMAEVCDYSFVDFEHLLSCSELLRDWELLSEEEMSPLPVVSLDYKQKVEAQVGRLPLERLEQRAYKKFQREFGTEDSEKYKRRFFGTRQLLEASEQVLSLLEEQHLQEISSAVMQPFCSAAENMVNVTLAINERSDMLNRLIHSENSFMNAIRQIDNADLKTVLDAYRQNRNSIAHSYQPLPMGAARSLARRTYETIQRLELLANPDGSI